MANSSDSDQSDNGSPLEDQESSAETTARDESNSDDRRNFMEKVATIGAVAMSVILGLFPPLAGLAVVFDPLLGKKKSKGKAIRVATLDSVPANGVPVRVPIVADLVDAWNREPNQPVGAVFLRRVEEDGKPAKVVAFNAICPHAGCSVGYNGDRNVYLCPCHTSAFELDGERIEPSPSPRGMDELVVDDKQLKESGEVWVEFVNYYPGKAKRTPKV